MTGRHAHWTRAVEQIFGTDFQPPKQAIGKRVSGLCPIDLEHCADLQMVLEVFPDRRVADHLNAVGSQQICRADTESCRICGELIAPADKITSRLAVTWTVCPRTRQAEARAPRLAIVRNAPGKFFELAIRSRSSKFDRPRAGRRKALELLQRQPER